MFSKEKHIDYSSQLVAILGAGESGVGAAVLAKKLGYQVFVSDFGAIKPHFINELNDIDVEWEQNGHSEEKIVLADLIIKSPGIPESTPIVQLLRTKKIPIIGEIEFASRHTNATLVGITGSNGKTTTTSLTYQMFKDSGRNVGIAGNIGDSFARQVANENYDTYILEVSSFQLDDTIDFKPHISIILNITPDHLDRYNYNFSEYVEAKFKITKNQTADDLFIYCTDNTAITEYLKNNQIKAEMVPFSIEEKVDKGAFLENEQLTINLKKKLSTCQFSI